MEIIEPGDKTAVRFTWVFNNNVINKNTAVRLVPSPYRGMLGHYLVAILPNIFIIISKTMSFYENIKEHCLFVIKFCTKNVLYNFYLKRTVMDKNV